MKGLEHLRNGNYNPKVNYTRVLANYNKLVDSGRIDEPKAVLRKFGGIISILGNKYKQDEKIKNKG